MEPNSKRGRPRRKSFEKLLKNDLSHSVPPQIMSAINPKLAEYVAYLERDGQCVTVDRALNLAQILKAMSGDLKAYETIRDTVDGGEKRSEDCLSISGIKVVVEDANNG